LSRLKQRSDGVAAAVAVPLHRSEVDRPSGVPAAVGALVVALGDCRGDPVPAQPGRFAFDG